MSRPAKRAATGSRPITDFFSRSPISHSSTSKPYGAEAYGALSRNLTNQTTNALTSSDEVSKLSRSGGKRRSRQGNIVFDCITVMSPSTEDAFLSSVEDSQPRDNDLLDSDDSDDGLPSIALYNKPMTGSLNQRSSRRSLALFQPSYRIEPSKSLSSEFSLKNLLREKEEMQKRQAERERLADLLNEKVEDYVPLHGDTSILNEDTEKLLGKESNDKLRGALTRIGGDLSKEGGYQFFRCVRKERAFDPRWIAGLYWLEEFGVEKARSGLVESGFVQDMMALNERLPREVVLWSLEHVAFEESQIAARAYSEMAIVAMGMSPGFITCESLNQVLCQFGADESLVPDSSIIQATKEEHKVECSRYGLVALAGILGQLPSSLSFEVRMHACLLLMKMTLDVCFGDDLLETVEASLSFLLFSFGKAELSQLISTLIQRIPDLSLQSHLLSRLPVHPPSVAEFRQSLANGFLGIPKDAAPMSSLTHLQTKYPFTAIKHDIPNQDTRQVKYAIQMFDIAIGHPPPEEKEVTAQIIHELQSMHRRIHDGRAAFLVRTEVKEIIQRLWMRLDHGLYGTRRERMESLDRYL